MAEEVNLADENRTPYRALLRPGDAKDRATLVKSWGPVLDQGPEQWLDRGWPWEELGVADLAFNKNPVFLVLSGVGQPAKMEVARERLR